MVFDYKALSNHPTSPRTNILSVGLFVLPSLLFYFHLNYITIKCPTHTRAQSFKITCGVTLQITTHFEMLEIKA